MTMHRSFIINEEERNRILNLHESSTKLQYLPLNEQAAPNLTCEVVTKFFASNTPAANAWKKFGCIPHHPNAMYVKDANGISFTINNVTYKSDGTTVDASGTQGTYSCENNPLFKNVIPRCWENFQCVPKHPKAEMRVLETTGGISYTIGEDNYFSKGRKYDRKLDVRTGYTCNDPIFKGKTGGGGGGGKPCAKSGDEILNKTAMLYMGCKGQTVKILQDYLVELGKLAENQVTSTFDRTTYNAVKQFQTENKPLKSDGIVGEKTWRKITQSQQVTMQTKDVETVGGGASNPDINNTNLETPSNMTTSGEDGKPFNNIAKTLVGMQKNMGVPVNVSMEPF